MESNLKETENILKKLFGEINEKLFVVSDNKVVVTLDKDNFFFESENLFNMHEQNRYNTLLKTSELNIGVIEEKYLPVTTDEIYEFWTNFTTKLLKELKNSVLNQKTEEQPDKEYIFLLCPSPLVELHYNGSINLMHVLYSIYSS